MQYRKISLFTLLGFVVSILIATSVSASTLNTPACSTNTPNDPSVVATIENINADKSSFQVVCLQGEKYVYTNLVVTSPELKSVLTGFGKGDRVVLEYKQENGQNNLQNLSVKTKNSGWGLALVALFVSMFLLWLVGQILLMWGEQAKGWLDVITGLDNRYSNSKTQIAFWFFILISSYIATNGLRILFGGLDFVGGVSIPQNLLLLSGLSAFTFVTAKGITQNKVDNAKAKQISEGDSSKKVKSGPQDGRRFADLFQNDDGTVDLSDFQMIIVTGLAFCVYFVQVVSFLSTIELRHIVSLPDLDTTILSVFGLGQGSFLVKKLVSPLVETSPPVASPQAVSTATSSGTSGD